MEGTSRDREISRLVERHGREAHATWGSSVGGDGVEVGFQLCAAGAQGFVKGVEVVAEVVELGFLVIELGDEAFVVGGLAIDDLHVFADAVLFFGGGGDAGFLVVDVAIGVDQGLLEINGFGESVADVLGDLAGLGVELKLADVGGENGDGLGIDMFGLDGEGGGIVGFDGDFEAIEGFGFFHGVGGADEFPAVGDGVFDDEGFVVIGVILGGVGLGGVVLAGDLEDAFDDFSGGNGGGLIVRFGIDAELEVDAEGEEAGLVGREVVDAGVAGVGVVIEDGDGAAEKMLFGGVFEQCAIEGVFFEDSRVVDGDAGSVDGVGDDGEHGGFLAREGDVGEGVLEEFAELGGGSGGGDGVGDIELAVIGEGVFVVGAAIGECFASHDLTGRLHHGGGGDGVGGAFGLLAEAEAGFDVFGEIDAAIVGLGGE